MNKRPNLKELDCLFDEGKDFQLTSREYEERTGVALPKAKSYLQHDSALAKWAKERGYIITDVQEDRVPIRTVSFQKERS